MVTPLDQRPKLGPYSGMNARSAKRFLSQTFKEAGLSFHEEDALELVLATTGFDRTGWLLKGTENLDPEVFQTLLAYMERRLEGEPIDHILGWREFYGRRFKISRDVLSPRADTETLIRGALSRLKSVPAPRILDLGTGSGAIGLTLLAEHEGAKLLATDISSCALNIAEENAEALGVSARARFARGTWWKAVPETDDFNMILSNPPYISDADMETLEPEVKRYDPDISLRGGADGLTAYRDILSRAQKYLLPGGWIGFEIGFDQGASVTTLLKEWGGANISLETDLGGLDRVIWAQKQS